MNRVDFFDGITTLKTWYLEPYDEMKWYDWNKDMSQFANEFPDVEFRLEGMEKTRMTGGLSLLKEKENKLSTVRRRVIGGKIKVIDKFHGM